MKKRDDSEKTNERASFWKNLRDNAKKGSSKGSGERKPYGAGFVPKTVEKPKEKNWGWKP